MKRLILVIALFYAVTFAYSQALGDVNNSSTIDIVDALLTAQYYVGLSPAGFIAAVADVNSSGSIDIVDALLIAQYYVGLITELPGQTTAPTPADTPASTTDPTIEPTSAPTQEPTPGPTQSTGNLVPNPGFEAGTTDGWYPFGETNTLAVSTAKAHTGTYSGLASNRTEDWMGPGLDLESIMVNGKTYELSLWVLMGNAASGTLKATVKKVDGAGEKYDPLSSRTVTDTNWIELSGFYTYTLSATLTELVFYVEGAAAGATFYVDDASVVEAQGDWIGDANSRIEQIRKRDATVTLQDTSGASIPNATLQITQKRRLFGFGSAFSETMKANAMYAEWFRNNFEWATFENEMKWYHTEASQGNVTYDDADPMLQFCTDNNIKVHGHCIFWEVQQYVPGWVQNLSGSALESAMTSRINSVVTRYKGKLPHWDVNNEMLHGSFFRDKLGSSIYTWMYNTAHTLDPDCILFVNDYNVVEQGETDLYVDQIQGLLEAGAYVNGIGAQGHFGTVDVTPPAILSRLDKMGQFGFPVWITEFDVTEPDENKRADKLETFYRLCFSHPAVDGVIMWGFWAGDHWRGADAAIVNQDWTVNAAGRRYQDLMEEWRTNANGQASNGNYSFRGFHGDYEVTVTLPNGYWETQGFALSPGSGAQNITIRMNTTATPAPTPRPTPENVGLRVYYKAGDASESPNSMKPHLKVVNVGSTTFNYQNLSIRYYYTKEGYSDELFQFDYVNMGSGYVTGTVGSGFLEVGFTSGAGTIAPGGDSGDIQCRVNKSDWSTYTQANDWSFDATKTAYAEWERVTLYNNGTHVWGLEPE